MKNIFKYGMMAFVAAAAVSSCDWTDPEPVDVKYDQITEADPDAYQQYLANLRAYRNNGHKKSMRGSITNHHSHRRPTM